ncbi:MAG: SDR family NAD(P)-dependent oxidoreductase, partial [Actinomycetota bacterium]
MGVAVVTGAGSGMGHATARCYLAHGWSVIGIDVAPDMGHDHPDFAAADVDVRDRAAVEAAIAGTAGD